jgi:Ca-activated chloride channel homolog
MKLLAYRTAVLALMLGVFAASLFAQSRRAARSSDADGSVLSVTAWRTDDVSAPIRVDNMFLYEDGIEQRIRNFSFDPSPSRIVLLLDNSRTVPADIELLRAAAMEFVYEIYDGDQLFVVAYDEKPEIIQEWTDEAEKLEASLKLVRKQGNPYLFDALSVTANEILLPLMPGTRKTAIVIIGDGLDRGSKVSYQRVLNELQELDITVYALQVNDRTGGAYRRDQPKAGVVISELTELTGGRAFPLAEARSAAKIICDELRKNRYLLSYSPVNTSTFEPKRLFLLADEGIEVRTKTFQPPTIK